MKLIASLLVLIFAISVSAQNASSGQSIQSALASKDYAHGLQLLNTAIQHSPRDARLWTLKGFICAALHKNSEALAAYDKALTISPDFLPALEGAAELEYKTSNPHAAARLQQVLKLRPNDPTAHAMLAALDFQQHDCAAAVGHFEQSKELIATRPSALAEYGSCLMDLDRPKDAIEVFQQLITEFPDSSRARFDLAAAQAAAHDGKDAVDTLQPLLNAENPDPDVLDLASSIYESLGQTPKAVALLRQAIVANPKEVKYYVHFATLSFNHQSFQVGIDMVNSGIERMPKAAPLYVARGVLYIQLAQYQKGEADFQTAARLDPRQASSAVAQGMAEIQQSNLDQALATVQTQLKDHPREAFLYYMKAQILVQKGALPGSQQFNDAIASARRSTELDPSFVLPRDVLGSLYLQAGKLDLAIEQCRLALRGNPSDQEALYHLIQALRHTGKASNSEMTALVKRLADLRRTSREQEASANRYKLYEPKNSSETPAPPSQ